ncbi:hypothetical protein QQS21_002044 [Conoideocrella luteorostrata]|uniref:Uncharacterized protein n=1 Tax=Conoideocrella luteorostrata TaxID=1105319 RepID=A0AAJ0FXN7_9HYPO|nr:hypothetical protein QQS21_002044 [Conoideocrella luteorostrata]
MPAPSASDSLLDNSPEKLTQLTYLCVLLGALNETYKSIENRKYSSGSPIRDVSLTKFQVFLNLLAQILDTRKGNTTITALACLTGPNGAEFVFCSNSRKEPELEHSKTFLSELLEFVSTNPDQCTAKPLLKQVLWRILAHNSEKLAFYLKSFSNAVEDCIMNYEEREEAEDPEFSRQLSIFQEKVNFPFDMSSDVFRSRTLGDCETLIKEIVKSKLTSFLSVVDRQIKDEPPDRSCDWCYLRHYLGRLCSYREAAEVIADAPNQWGTLFENFKVRYMPSSPSKRISISPSLNLEQLASGAFPNRDLSEFDSDIAVLREYGLDDQIRNQVRILDKKSLVHAEIQLYDYLVRQGKTLSSGFWDSSAFIATSKPPCRLCHFYFDYSDNNIVISPPHMNLYPRWLLPDVKKEEGHEAVMKFNNQLDEIIEDLQRDTEILLAEKMPVWKRNDSRTDSYGVSGWSGSTGSKPHGGMGHTSRMAGTGDMGGSAFYDPPSSLSSTKSWHFVNGSNFHGG